MAAVKRYGQFCAVARALDQVGDRWTLLLVRELMIRPLGYSSLLARLPGMATNLLAERLTRLQEHGLVERDPSTRRYQLTARGLALRPVLHELIRWGAPLMTAGPGDDTVDEQWALLALDALLTSAEATGPATRIALQCGETAVGVTMDASGRRVMSGAAADADAVLTGSLPDLLSAACTGVVAAGLTVSGDEAAARRVLAPPAGPSEGDLCGPGPPSRGQ